MHPHVFWTLVLCVLLLIEVWLSQRSRPFHPCSHDQATPCSHLPLRLKPRSPLDCPICRLASGSTGEKEPTRAPVRPWREVKSRRGTPKRINTEGVACPNQTCPYSGISDAEIHAVVSDGSYGKAERIQRWRGLACQGC